MKTILIITVILAIGVISYFAFPKFRKWVLYILAAIGIAVGGTGVIDDTEMDPVDDGIEIPVDTTDTTDDVVLIPDIPKDTIQEPEIDSITNPLQDQTDTLRGLFSGNNDVKLKNKLLVANGMLPEDFEVRYGDAGEVGIIRITGSDKRIIGAPTTIKTTKEAISKGYVFARNHKTASKRRHIIFDEAESITLKDIKVVGTGIETDATYPTGTYTPSKYGEHAYSIESSQNITLENCDSELVWGDGIYIGMASLQSRGNKNIKISGGKTISNGRQGIGIVEGENILIDGHEITGSPRSGIDIEINHPDHVVKNTIIKNSPNIVSGLYPFAMGGKGTLDGVKFENNKYTAGRTAYCVSGGGGIKRKNIVFSGNTTDYEFGSTVAPYRFIGFENLIIENEKRPLVKNRSKKIIYLSNGKGQMIIRNNDFENARYVMLRNIDPNQVIVYGNKQQLYYVIVPPEYEEDSYSDTSNAIPFPEYDVEKYGEPDTEWAEEITGETIKKCSIIEPLIL